MYNETEIIEQEPIMSASDIDKLLDLSEAKNFEQKTAPKVERKVPHKAAPEQILADQIQTDNAEQNILARMAQMEQELKELRAGRNGVKVAQATKKVVDFSNITEKDVYDLKVPIEALTHELPDSSLIKLRDPNYIGRWVSTHPMRLGLMKAVGFSYVTREDLQEDLMMNIEYDENGQYRYIDVVAMKCTKAKYLGALRKNHLRALTVVDPKKAHEVGKAVVEQELTKGYDPEDPAKRSYGRDYRDAREHNKMEVYI